MANIPKFMKIQFIQILSAVCALEILVSLPACNKIPSAPENHPLLAATKEAPWVNELGMEFIPLPGKPGVYLCRTETRVRDFHAYVTATGYRQVGGARVLFVRDNQVDETLDRTATWEKPGFDHAPDHPVCCVSWEEARAFCDWLSSKDPKLIYRLPSDAEWSAALDPGKYPWGNQWPRPMITENYWGKEAIGNLPGNWGDIADYEDAFARTAPVASFPANVHGFFDLGGNLSEWCEDRYQAVLNDKDILEKYPFFGKDTYTDGTPYQMLRGGSWSKFAEMDMRSSLRSFGQPRTRTNTDGFRCVVSQVKS